MVTQSNSAIGVIVKVNGHVTAKSGGIERELKPGDLIYQNDEIIAQGGGSAKILMTDGNFLDIAGKAPFEAANYLLTPEGVGYPSHASAEAIQTAVEKGVNPQHISEAILSCIPIDEILP